MARGKLETRAGGGGGAGGRGTGGGSTMVRCSVYLFYIAKVRNHNADAIFCGSERVCVRRSRTPPEEDHLGGLSEALTPLNPAP
jgi:hypothetical protein